MQKRWFRMLFRRRVAVILSLVLQAFLMICMVYSSSRTYLWLYYLLNTISIFAVLHIISTGERASSKLLWSVIILVFPLFGGLLYLMVRMQDFTMTFKKRLKIAEDKIHPYYTSTKEPCPELADGLPPQQNQYHFLTETCGFYAYPNTGTEYLSPGEECFQKMLSALKQAEHFIFLEYFIVQEGRFWNSVLDILKQKAAKGVDVRLIYDDMGCFMLLPLNYQKYLESLGIRCVVFNKFRPVLSTLQNHRDHRKIMVVDGKWAFTGGINLADEYINQVEKLGHWKDAAIMMTGEAVKSFTLMFLTMWQALTGQEEMVEPYLTAPSKPTENDGFIIPFCDSPVDKEYVSEHAFLNLINSSKEYLYIQTPYLIIDDIMVAALILAAKNGVDVRILVPHKPDKWYVHMTTRSYYRELITGGVKIYEYLPGFIHSKVLAADDNAIIGTINMDCRSLYLHFECGVWLFKSQTVKNIREDFIKTLEGCKQIKLKDCKIGVPKRILQHLFRLFAPLM